MSNSHPPAIGAYAATRTTRASAAKSTHGACNLIVDEGSAKKALPR